MTPTERFEPSIGDVLRLFGDKYKVQEHPNAPGIVFAASGGKADVYQLLGRGKRRWGLKVFFAAFRDARILDSTKHLHTIENYKGLMVARRRVVTPTEGDACRYRDLHYSVLMPWVSGRTWYDSLEQRRLQQLADAKARATRFLQVISRLEQSGIAHTDISSGNVSFEHSTEDTQLLDLEDMYLPNVPKPSSTTTGTPGYDNPGGQETWRPAGDRYAAAILAAEILLMSDETLAAEVDSNSFFTGNRLKDIARNRFNKAEPYLHEVSPSFAELFTAAWNSASLEDCPQIQELRKELNRDVTRVVSPYIPTSPPPRPPQGQTSPQAPVTWEPLGGVEFDLTPSAPTDSSIKGVGPAPPAFLSVREKTTHKWRWFALFIFVLVVLLLWFRFRQ